jgi:deazaflavin-dependent oxidoreductase (nitroreductase family)
MGAADARDNAFFAKGFQSEKGKELMMKTEIENALNQDRLIDITTVGAKTGKPHRIEIAFHKFDDGIYISGLPGKRDWYANLVAHPEFTFHLKQSTHADLAARATPVTESKKRLDVLKRVTARWNRQAELEQFVSSSPLVQVTFEGDK